MLAKKINRIEFLPLYLWRIRLLIPGLIVLMFLLSLLIYNNFTINQVNRLLELEHIEQELKDNLVKNYAQVKNVPAYQARFNELRGLESVINAKFPSSNEISSLLIQINQVAEDSNVSIANFTPKDTKEINLTANNSGKDKIMSQEFSIVANARYLNFVDFIFRIARLPRVIAIQNIRLSRMDNNTVNVSFDIKIYFSSK